MTDDRLKPANYHIQAVDQVRYAYHCKHCRQQHKPTPCPLARMQFW